MGSTSKGQESYIILKLSPLKVLFPVPTLTSAVAHTTREWHLSPTGTECPIPQVTSLRTVGKSGRASLCTLPTQLLSS